MQTPVPPAHRALALLLGTLLVLVSTQSGAFPGILNDWQARYGAASPSGDNARCQLCHGNASGGSPFNAYGWDVLLARADAACDLDGSGDVSNAEAFFCVELLDSDADGSASDNGTEIGLGTQPGWALGASNTLFTRAGTLLGQTAPDDIGQLDPDGTEPPPPPPPPPPTPGEAKPKKLKKRIVVKPGDSIQDALDRIQPGGTIIVKPGIYRELADATNGLQIAKSGIRLIGETRKAKKLKKAKKAKSAKKTKVDRVILQNAGNQRNGIVVVPPERTDCMGCHTDMAPPFPLREGVPPGMPKEDEPWLYDIVIRGITIQGFTNNGLFTEHVDGFEFSDIESLENKNYGIFPTLSRNGIITRSRATGADDSGIWVETSENVVVTHNLVEHNVNGFEVSNSDDITIAFNEMRFNTVGAAILLLPDIFDDRAGAKRIDLLDNWIHDNNKENTASPGSILSFVPPGVGALYLGVDDSLIARNRIENNITSGIAIADYCLVVSEVPSFTCFEDPTVTPEFRLDNPAERNRVVDNILIDNGLNPPDNPFAFAAGDLSLIALIGTPSCYADNVFKTFYSIIGRLPACK